MSLSTLKTTGSDMSHVICEPGAATVIKTYSPNLMVHPYMRQSHHAEGAMKNADEVAKPIIEMLDRLHVIVVGPGLGRDPLMQETAGKIVKAAREKGMGVIIDAVGPSFPHQNNHNSSSLSIQSTIKTTRRGGKGLRRSYAKGLQDGERQSVTMN